MSDAAISQTIMDVLRLYLMHEHVVFPLSPVRSDTLTDMVAHMREKVGLVHQIPFAYDRPGLPSTLEQVRDLHYIKQAHYESWVSALLGRSLVHYV